MAEVIKVEDCGENIGDYDMQIYNAILIPENATNGDMVKAMFPNLEWTGAYKDEDFYSLDSDTPFSPRLKTFRSWWNAPYKGV